MKRDSRILLIDTSSILHLAKHAGKDKVKTKDKSTYIMFGFLLKLQYLMARTKADVCVFARDGHPEDSIRKKIYPSYKEKRQDKEEKTPEQIELNNIAYPQFLEVEEEILPSMGYQNIFQEKKLEADDIIGSVCKSNPNREIVIVTTDQDMYQLLSPTTCILNTKTNQYFTEAGFVKKYDIEPRMWKRVKAIAGCSTDEVRGIDKVGETTAIKFIKGELPHHYKAYQNIVSKQGRRIINRNKSLVILPFRGTPEYKIKSDAVSKIRLEGMAKKYGFVPILNDLENWNKTLKGWR